MSTPYRDAAGGPPASELVVTLDAGGGGFSKLLRAVGLGARRPSAVLRVAGGELEVRGVPARTSGGVQRAPLSALHDVALDTKVIRRMLEGGSAVPAVRFLEAQPGPETDVARIVLWFEDGTSVALTDDYVAHMTATEWLGKIRVFLRQAGWVPLDERPGGPSTA